MKFKTKQLSDRLTGVISRWPAVECVALNEAALPDTLHPYFALILDIYCDGPLPSPEERCALYGEDVAAFETAGDREGKDRFLVGDIPVRLEYKSTKMVDDLVALAEGPREELWLLKGGGTYGFYRLAQGDVLYSRGEWIHGIRRRLAGLGGAFWTFMRGAHESRMEHFLSDLGAARLQGDDFYTLISAAGFIKSACLTLFCVNRRFEPAHRAYYDQVRELPVLPPSFDARMETFLRSGAGLSEDQKFHLAQAIARDIIAL